jgi:hypothetical protein
VDLRLAAKVQFARREQVSFLVQALLEQSQDAAIGLLWPPEREDDDLKEFIKFADSHCWAEEGAAPQTRSSALERETEGRVDQVAADPVLDSELMKPRALKSTSWAPAFSA